MYFFGSLEFTSLVLLSFSFENLEFTSLVLYSLLPSLFRVYSFGSLEFTSLGL
jgi:hypothetical protein